MSFFKMKMQWKIFSLESRSNETNFSIFPALFEQRSLEGSFGERSGKRTLSIRDFHSAWKTLTEQRDNSGKRLKIARIRSKHRATVKTIDLAGVRCTLFTSWSLFEELREIGLAVSNISDGVEHFESGNFLQTLVKHEWRFLVERLGKEIHLQSR